MAKKKKSKKPKIKKHTPAVEERMKSIQNIQVPDKNPDKVENDGSIDKFFRFGLRRGGFRQSPKEKARMIKKENRPKKSTKF